jgi:hypothetical protein
MKLNTIFFVVLSFGCVSAAQEIRQIDLTGVPEDAFRTWIPSYTYRICGTEKAKTAPGAVRVSVESLVPTDIHPKEHLSVVLKVENSGLLPVELPVSGEAPVIPQENGAVHYRALIDIMAGFPSGALRLGQLELYGSSFEPNTTVSLKPGEWITLRGDITIRRWSATEQVATAYSQLQFYVDHPSPPVEGQCTKQVSGATIAVRFTGLTETH